MSGADVQAVGVDVGGTKTAALRITEDGAILERASLPTPADDMAATLDTMIDAVRSVLTPEVVAVGISAAGLVDAEGGTLRFAPNLAWRDARLVQCIVDETRLPATADNDNTAAAWGELRLGAARGHTDVLLVGVGTGIGGGIVVGGRLLRGAHGFAGEVGHVVVEPDGEPCGCGNRGCWETVASGRTILRDGRRAVTRHAHSLLAEMAGGDQDRNGGDF